MKVYGQRIHDTWWMTETGGQLICNYPCMEIKPGSMGTPVPGVQAAIIDDQGNELPPYRMGNLAIRTPWPSMMRKIWNNPTKYEEYFHIPGWYVSGDSAYQDEEGYFWFQGRIDDVINTSGRARRAVRSGEQARRASGRRRSRRHRQARSAARRDHQSVHLPARRLSRLPRS